MTPKEIRYQNIAISGDSCAGTTTLAKTLKDFLDWELLNAGEFFRNWHQQQGIPLEDTNAVPPELDRQIDYSFRDQMTQRGQIIFESRLAGWLAKDFDKVLRILCIAKKSDRLKRYAVREGLSLKTARTKLHKRAVSLQEKFKFLYDVDDYLDPRLFHLVVDTSKLSRDQSFNLVKDFIVK